MSTAATYMTGAFAILRRDWLLWISYRTRAVSILLTSLFGLALFYYISKLVRVEQFPTPESYFAFVVVGMVSLTVLTSTLVTGPMIIRQELVAGTFERLLVSPFGAVAGIASMTLFPLLFGIGHAAVMLLLAGVIFGLPIEWSTAPLAVPAAVLGALAFMPFGFLISALMLLMKQASAAAGFVVTGISIIAGLYFPVSLLPDWIRWASDVQPFTPAVDLLRNTLVGTPMHQEAWVAVAKVAGFTVVLMPLSVMALVWAVAWGRRRGTISEF
jgi:ABC-2 type transport system permease protein